MQRLERRIALLEQGRDKGCLHCELAELNGIKEPRCTADHRQTLREALSALNGYPANQLPELRNAST